MDTNKGTLSSPPSIFFAYIVTTSLCILIFRLISPGEAPPLPAFARAWGLIRGLLDILALFPALALSALVLPFGLAPAEKSARGLSQHLFQRMKPSLVTAICAAGLYALLFFLVLPLAQNYAANLRFKGEIYQMAKERAQNHRRAGEWAEAYQFMSICDSIWDDSPEMASLRKEVDLHADETLYGDRSRIADNTSARDLNSASVSAIPGQGQPLTASDAIDMGEKALKEKRLFDAHWLATVGERIARPGSPEVSTATRLAARAWNEIELLHPSSAEREKYELYRLKLSGYQAMRAGDWIRAYYIFKELLTKTPRDPDAENYLKHSEKGTKEVAFFIDELDASLGEKLADVVLSLPGGPRREGERSVMRVDSLYFHPDFAYGTGIELMAFDAQSRLQLSLQAHYAKFLPITIDNQPQVIVLMRALDRADKNRRWEPVLKTQGKTDYSPDTAQFRLNVDYETFLMLAQLRQRMPSLYISELFAASGIAEETGYITEVFQAEILRRLGACLFFLPAAVLVLTLGVSLRARKTPRFLFVLSIPVLPLLFNGLVYLYRIILNNAAIALTVNAGFSTALPVFVIMLSVSFVLSLIVLAVQHD